MSKFKKITFLWLLLISVFLIFNFSFLISSAFSPCWTPDGKTIVYQSMGQIYSINIDSLESKPLTTSNDCYNPCVKWKPK